MELEVGSISISRLGKMAQGEQKKMDITVEREGNSLDPYDDDKQLPELVCRTCKYFLRVS